MWLKNMGVNRNRREKSRERHHLAPPALRLLHGFGPDELIRKHTSALTTNGKSVTTSSRRIFGKVASAGPFTTSGKVIQE